VSQPACPACGGGWPPADQRIAEFPLSVAYLHDDQFFPGWTLLVLKRHATELFELTREERAQLIEEVSAVARALHGAFGGVRKVNYELLGNQLAHIHWHLVPRLADDPAPSRPVWEVRHEPKRLSADQRIDRLARIRACLSPC
jgi:diadenosine tetraphosphate (Ap4A) HIT family hydrolase